MNNKNGNSSQGERLGKKPRRSLGPVANLEAYVRPDWWRKIFNSFYLKTDGDVVDDDIITQKEVAAFLDILKLDSGDRILDLCCGQGRHSLEICRKGFTEVEGLDRSRYLIQKAKMSARKERLSIKFREGDARKLPYKPDSFEAVMVMGNSFGYFETIQDDLRVLKEIFRISKPWGKLLIDISDGDYLKENYQSRTWEWIDKKCFVCRERSLSLDGQSLISREIITNTEKGVSADQFYAERLYTPESMTKLLKAAGFSEIKFHKKISTDSLRNQDLGMMQQRIVASAMVRKEWTAECVTKNKKEKEVAVLLGDPNKPDPLKPLCVFDDDDFYTIDQMKSALKDLKGYRFHYLDNHDSLFQDLLKLNGRIDYAFNLCDEGYGNDPRKELHVPALLEQLGIHYTGSGPQCLAFCYDRSLIRGIAQEMGIPVAQAFFVKHEDATFELPFGFPVIVKPNCGDSSFGINKRSVAHTLEELLNAVAEIRDKFGYDNQILVEEFLSGKDLTLGVMGNPPDSYKILPILEEDYSALPEGFPKICGYEAKWLPDSPYWKIKSVPAKIPEEMEKSIAEYSLRLFERLDCRDYVRFDWRMDAAGNPRLLEVNPNPGWCWDGHMAKMAKLAGMTYSDMLLSVLNAVEKRITP